MLLLVYLLHTVFNKLASSYTAVVADDAVASYATYREAVQLYRSNLRRALQNVSTKPGLIIPYEIDAPFPRITRAAGLSRDNIIQGQRWYFCLYDSRRRYIVSIISGFWF